MPGALSRRFCSEPAERELRIWLREELVTGRVTDRNRALHDPFGPRRASSRTVYLIGVPLPVSGKDAYGGEKDEAKNPASDGVQREIGHLNAIEIARPVGI